MSKMRLRDLIELCKNITVLPSLSPLVPVEILFMIMQSETNSADIPSVRNPSGYMLASR